MRGSPLPSCSNEREMFEGKHGGEGGEGARAYAKSESDRLRKDNYADGICMYAS